MTPEIHRTVQLIHSSDSKAVIATTGGGSGIFPLLMRRGNASKTVILGIIPYDVNEHVWFLGRKPDKFVDDVDSRMLAVTAYQRATKVSPLNAIGVGATSSLQKLELDGDLVTYKPERDSRRHEIHVSLHRHDLTATWSLVSSGPMNPQSGSPDDPLGWRLWEEEVNDLMILKALAKGCGVDSPPIERHEGEITHRLVHDKDVHPSMNALIQRQVPFLACVCGEGEVTPVVELVQQPELIVSGSFNPVHFGHTVMAGVAADKTGKIPFFEMPISNPDKGWLDFITIQDRLESFRNLPRPVMVLLTNAPTFLEKSRLFPSATFALGMDTFTRIIDRKYYPTMTVDEVAAQFVLNNSKFLVFGRHDARHGRFIDSFDALYETGVVVPDSFDPIVTYVPKAEFSADVSSTQIRNGGAR